MIKGSGGGNDGGSPCDGGDDCHDGGGDGE